ncbi:MAG: nicotinate-nucleotide--dimethylbenzimidazole phosphoribosyltransferase [Atopobiaceae bacterium]|nr:nicotinate-nucleotide--dimethylbenzimidazole phosphoribosyltransferase [Atopobiaceae bacterium]
MSTNEELLSHIIAGIEPADTPAMGAAQKRWNSLAKPVGGLGLLEELIVRIAGISRTPDVRLNKRELIVACADNGVVEHGVSASDASVTRIIAQALGEGESTACYMARQAGCSVTPVDVGMRRGPKLPNVVERAVRPGGTADISSGPAMTREECVATILNGIELVRERSAAGIDVLLTGEMGIGNTTTTTAVTCALLKKDPRELVGPGAGLSQEDVARKAAIIESVLALNQPNADDPLDVLCKVGGFDLAAICGICLGGARYRVPILLDGIITLAAALCAVRLCPMARFALLGSHVSEEPCARLLLDELRIDAPIHAHMHLGEGTGALAALPLLDVALAVYTNSRSLEQLNIDGYHPATQPATQPATHPATQPAM